MKLLFDQNLSFKLCQALADLFPGSSQVRLLGMASLGCCFSWPCADGRLPVFSITDYWRWPVRWYAAFVFSNS